MDNVVAGALVGAGAALGAQAVAVFAQRMLQDRSFVRTDAGNRRMVRALVSEVGKFVYQCRTVSPVDWEKMRVVLERTQDIVYKPEVATALNDVQAEAFYAALGSIEVAYQFTLQQPWGKNAGQYNALEAIDYVKATFKDPCAKLADFWSEMNMASSL